jgi:hypothetical protein
MHAPIRPDALTYAMYPTAYAQPITTATHLDLHHRATLTARSAPLLRRAVATYVSGMSALCGPGA